MPQSRGSMAVARAALALPGHRVLDLCAAPGGKTTHLAALVQDDSPEFVAVEVHPGRAQALVRTCQRMGARCVEVRCADGREPVAGGPFDRVLVDPPCSGLGTLQSRPDLRWQTRRSEVTQLAEKQGRLLAAGASRDGVRRGARVLGVHDLPGRGRRRYRRVPRRAPGLLAAGSACS